MAGVVWCVVVWCSEVVWCGVRVCALCVYVVLVLCAVCVILVHDARCVGDRWRRARTHVQVRDYVSVASALASLQIVDLATGSAVCSSDALQGSELLRSAWVVICLLGWYGAWDAVASELEGSGDRVSLLTLLNPLVALFRLLTKRDFGRFLAVCFALLCKRVGDGTEVRSYGVLYSAVLCVMVAAGFSIVLDAGGLGGLTTAALLVALGGLGSTLGLDRLLWLGWWVALLVWQSDRVLAVVSRGEPESAKACHVMKSAHGVCVRR